MIEGQALNVIGGLFGIKGDLVSAVPYGNGHIHGTYLATYSSSYGKAKYIHQRINREVFPKPTALMENFERITGHIASILATNGTGDIHRRVLIPLRSHDDKCFVYDDSGELWRTTRYISGTSTYDIVSDPAIAFEVGRCFGEFQNQMLSLPLETLHMTIEDFHHTRRRYDALVETVQRDRNNRAALVKDEIAFASERESYVDPLEALSLSGQLPRRIVHNDTKANNLLFDARSGKGLCVTDLDTTMPGLALHDFGDMVRTVTNASSEDEVDLNQVHLQPELFRSLVKGYLLSAGSFLTGLELNQLVFASKVVVLETGIRFLTDYLEGDLYFKTSRDSHNLDRCRNQFKLLLSIEEREEELQAIVSSSAI